MQLVAITTVITCKIIVTKLSLKVHLRVLLVNKKACLACVIGQVPSAGLVSNVLSNVTFNNTCYPSMSLCIIK